MQPDDARSRAAERLVVLDAVAEAVERRAELMAIVGGSGSADEAAARLRAEWGLTDLQAVAVLDLQVRRFAGRERDRITDERTEVRRRAGAPPTEP